MQEEPISKDSVCASVPNHISENVVSEVLSAMAELGWLSPEGEQPVKWHPGPGITAESSSDFSSNELVRSVEDVEELDEGENYIGRVDRISSSGNAIIWLPPDISQDLVNLGPIDEGVKSEYVRFTYKKGIWGKCLNKKYTYRGYEPHDGRSKSKLTSKSFNNSSSANKKTVYSGGNSPFDEGKRSRNSLLNGKH